ncbi:hypothetical protein Hanom_Chr04g00291781 [Helianthus anomalus]
MACQNRQAEKNELRGEKLVLKAEKAKMEPQAEGTKIPVFPGYGYIRMWQYLPQTTCDTSHDHELWPPAD